MTRLRRLVPGIVISAWAALFVSACATVAAPPPPPPPPPPLEAGQTSDDMLRDWRGIIVAHDLDRYQRRDDAWKLALRQSRESRGHGDMARVGALIRPDQVQDFVTPPPGNYRCRTIKLGSQSPDHDMGYIVYGWFACRIEITPAGLKLSKLTGSQRPSGILFPENDRQMVFLGSMSLTNEPPARSYGQRPERDMVGVLERVAETRWRLVIPWPQNESTLDLIELVPAPRARR